jgi:hypothetical protein
VKRMSDEHSNKNLNKKFRANSFFFNLLVFCC